MEREPEEDNNTQYCEQSIQTLLDLLSGSNLLLGSIFDALNSLFLSGVGENLLRCDEDHQRDQHCSNRSDERIVDTLVEYLQVVLARCEHIVYCTTCLGHQLRQVSHSLGSHCTCILNELVAECGQLCVINHIIGIQPPLTQQRSNERSDQTTDIDKYVENLETRITLALCQSQSLGTLLGSLSLEVVIHLTNDCLQVALEQTVTKCNQEQCEAGQSQQPSGVTISCQDGNRQQHVTACHHDQARLNRTLVILLVVSDITTYQCQQIDTSVEYRIDSTADCLVQTELRAEEQHQHCIHNIVAKTLTHITQSSSQQTFGMSFEHNLKIVLVKY